jgi:MYXO-CTERM domain-containing protein
MALGFSLSSSSTFPGIAWTGRLASDTKGTMGQGEGSVQGGAGVEIGTFSNGQLAQRWGDYSNMTVDPSDDCTFWYTQELYPSNGTFNWDTYVASVKFPNCAANDFSPSLAPAAQNLQQGKSATYTVSTALDAGTAESIALYAQDLPSGVTAAFNPASVTAGASSTLTLSATASAALSTTTFMVIGKAPSAVHAATAQVTVVVPCTPLTTCPAGDNCGTVSDNCGGQVSCGPACTLPQTCGGGGTANVCGCTPITGCDGGANCGTISNGCGGSVTCGPSCTSPQSCGGGGTPNVCGCTPITGCDAGANCGTVPNGCGGSVTCGPSCTSPQTCGGGGTANVCGCTPLTACPANDTCGTLSDNCGGTVTCTPGCTGSQTCVANKCVAPGSDGGTQQQGDAGSGGGGGSNGCGCGATSPSSSAALLGLGVLAWLGLARRRSSPSPAGGRG